MLAIVNPVAGNGRGARAWRRLRTEVDGLAAWEWVMTERVGHARELAASAVKSGFDRVFAVGGDCTVCEVATGLAHSETALGVIPVGTGNDTALNLGIPSDPLAAARSLSNDSVRIIDLGEIRTATSTTCFVNVAGFGFDAEVASCVARMSWLKALGGTLPYVAGVLQTVWQYRSPGVRLRLDDRDIDSDIFLIAVANGPSYGGGMLIAPQARPDDGLFDVCVVSDLRRLEVLRLLPKLYSGGHVGHPAVCILRCREVTAEADRRVRCQADGELVGDLPARFSVSQGALRLVNQTMPSA